MYIKLLNLSVYRTKRAMGFILLSLLNVQFLQADTSINNSLSSKMVSVSLQKATIEEVLSVLEQKTEYTFGYSQKVMSINKKVNLNYQNESLSKILVDLSKKMKLKFRLINNTISVTTVSKYRNTESISNVKDQIEISGTVKDENEQPLPGASIVVKGTTRGVVSDINGAFMIKADENDVLTVTFVGYLNQEVPVNGRSSIEIQMTPDAEQLEEVVVTAFGIERDKKSVTYATQNVKVDELTKARTTNLVSGLSGKVAGLSVTQSGQGVGGSAKVLLRGNRSISGSSQPLYIVDGVPLAEGQDINNLSPDDIEDISVLRGPNAAALYGSRANNGAIVVKTKSGSGSEGVVVSVNSSFMASTPTLLWDYQNEYGQGTDGIYSANSVSSWGPAFDGSQQLHWTNDPNNPNFGGTYAYSAQPDNVRDFYQTGHNLSTNISVTSGKENSHSYISYTFTDAEGVVPGNALNRHNVNVKVNQNINDKLQIEGKVNYIRSAFENQLYPGESFENPNRHALRMPRNIRTSDVEIFEFINTDKTNDQHFWLPNDNGGANPYWASNRNLNTILSERVLSYLSLKYDITPELSILGRSALDRSSSYREDKWYNDTYIDAINGEFKTKSKVDYEWNTDFLISYSKSVNEDWAFNINAGGNQRKLVKESDIETINGGLANENKFGLDNAVNLTSTQVAPYEKRVNSLYGFGQLSFRDAIFLDLTARNDWSSTLPPDAASYFYPSIGLTAVLSDLITLPQFVSFAKFRASYAEVGNDTETYRLDRSLQALTGARAGALQFRPTAPESNLKSERTKSLELGGNVKFFEGRVGLDFTWYKSNSTDQLFSVGVPVATNKFDVFVNGGDVENTGIELTLSTTPFRSGNFSWNIDFNFSKNQSKVSNLSEKIETDFAVLTGGNSTSFLGEVRVQEGQPFGEWYSKGFERDDQNRVLIGNDGLPLLTSGKTVPIGNFNPDWLGGIRNVVNYKNFSLSVLIDIRHGGDVVSYTEAVLAADGVLKSTLPGRDGSLVFGENIFANETAVLADGTPNNIQVSAQDLWSAIGGRNAPTGEAFVKSASNARVREVVLGYALPKSILNKTPFSSGSISFVGRNLFFLWNNAENFDPEVFMGTNNSEDGFDSFSPPTSRDFGLNLNFTF